MKSVLAPEEGVEREGKGAPNRAVPSCQSEYQGSRSEDHRGLVGTSLLTKPLWPMENPCTADGGSQQVLPAQEETLEAAAGECAARNVRGSCGLFLAVLQSGFLKRH